MIKKLTNLKSKNRSKKFFDLWNFLKQKLDNGKRKDFYFRERDVWFSYMGKNVGYEQDGKGETFSRPVLILKKFNKDVFWGIPMTSQKKEGKYYLKLNFIEGKDSYLILSQLRLMDVKRLYQRLGKITKHDLKLVKSKLIDFLK